MGGSEWCRKEFRRKDSVLMSNTLNICSTFSPCVIYQCSAAIFLSPEERKSNPSSKNISPGITQRARMVVINTLLVIPKLYMAGGILCQLRSSALEFIFHAPKSMYLASKEFESCPSITFTLSSQLCSLLQSRNEAYRPFFS